MLVQKHFAARAFGDVEPGNLIIAGALGNIIWGIKTQWAANGGVKYGAVSLPPERERGARPALYFHEGEISNETVLDLTHYYEIRPSLEPEHLIDGSQIHDPAGAAGDDAKRAVYLSADRLLLGFQYGEELRPCFADLADGRVTDQAPQVRWVFRRWTIEQKQP